MAGRWQGGPSPDEQPRGRLAPPLCSSFPFVVYMLFSDFDLWFLRQAGTLGRRFFVACLVGLQVIVLFGVYKGIGREDTVPAPYLLAQAMAAQAKQHALRTQLPKPRDGNFSTEAVQKKCEEVRRAYLDPAAYPTFVGVSDQWRRGSWLAWWGTLLNWVAYTVIGLYVNRPGFRGGRLV
jgi:hypothetical protein